MVKEEFVAGNSGGDGGGLTALLGVIQHLIATRDRREIAQSVADVLVDSLGYVNSWVALVDESGVFLDGLGGAGRGVLPDMVYRRVSLLEDTTNPPVVAARTRQPLVINDPLSDEHLSNMPHDIKIAFGHLRIAVVPIMRGGECSGVIFGARPSTTPPLVGEDVELLEAVAGVMSVTLHNVDLLEHTRSNVEEMQVAQRELEESRVLYQSLVEALPQYVYRVDKDGRVVFGNAAYFESLGRPPEECIGKTAHDFFPRELADKYRADDMKVVESGETIDTVEEHEAPLTGEMTYVHVVKVPIRNSAGGVIGVQGVYWDVTERRRAEDALERERALLRTLIDTLPDYIFVKDAHSRYLINNMAHLRELGAETQEELVGKTDFDIYGPELAQKYYDDEQEVIRTGEPMIEQEDVVMFPTGDKQWVWSTKVPLRDDDGEIVGLVCMARDVTRQKEAEEELLGERTLLRTLIDNLPDRVFVKDTESRFVINNRAHMEHLGVETQEELVGKIDFDFFPREMAEGFYADEQEVIRTGKALERREEMAISAAGEEEWLLTSKVPLRDAEGNVRGIVGISRNITFIKEQQDALERRTMQLQAAAEVSQAVTSILDQEELFESVVSLIRESFGLYYVGLFIVDEAEEYAVLRAGTGEAGRAQVERGHRLRIGEESMIGWSISKKMARIALDVGEDAVRFENPFLPDTRSEMALPLVTRGRAIGALTVQSTEEAAFSNEDIIALQTMAYQLANAIENARLYSEARIFGQLVENAPDFVGLGNMDLKIEYISPSGLKMLGYTEEDVKTLTVPDLYDEEWMEFAQNEAIPTVLGEGFWVGELPFKHKDGHLVPVVLSLFLIRDDAGNPLHFGSVAHDVTDILEAQKERERLLRELQLFSELAETSPALVSMADANNNLFYFNPAGLRMLGYSWDEIESNKLDMLHPEDGVEFMYGELLPELFEKEYWQGELTYRAKDGTLMPTLSSMFLVRDDEGKPVALGNMATDISQIKEQQDVLERRTMQLQAAAEVSQAATSILDQEELFESVVSLIRERFGLYYVGLFIVDEAEEYAVLRAGTGEAGRAQVERGHRLRIGGESMIGWSISNRQARIALDVGEDAVRFENPFLPDTRSEMALPLVTRGRAIGALTVQSTEGAAFSNEDIIVLQTMAYQLANALENARLLQEAQAALEEVQKVQRYYIREAWEGFLQEEKQELGFSYGEQGAVPSEELFGVEIARAVRERRSVAVPEHVPGVITGDGGPSVPENGDSALVAPISLRGEVIGALGTRETGGPRVWSEDDISLIEEVSSQVALAVESARLFEQTQNALSETARLYDAGARISQAETVDEIIDILAEEIQLAMGGNLRGNIAMIGPNPARRAEWVEVRAQWGQHFSLKVGDWFGVDQYPILRNAEIRETMVLQDAKNDPRLDEASRAVLIKEGASSVAFIPLISGTILLGLITIASPEPRKFTDREVRFLGNLADRAAVGIESRRLFEQAIEERDRVQLLYGVGQALSGGLDLDTILHTTVGFAPQLGAEHAFIVLQDADGELHVASSLPAIKDMPRDAVNGMANRMLHEGIDGWVLKHNKSALVVDARRDDRIRADVIADLDENFFLRISSVMCAQLTLGQGNMRGTVTLVHAQANMFDEDDLSLLESLALRVSVAIQNASLFEATATQAERLAVLNEITTAISATLDVGEIVNIVQGEISRIVPVSSFSVAFYEQEVGRFHIHVTGGDRPDELKAGRELPLEGTSIGDVVKTGRPNVDGDISAHPDKYVEYGMLHEMGIRSIMNVPLVYQRQIIGTMNLGSSEPDAYSETDLMIVEQVASDVAIGISNARLFEETQRRAVQLETSSDVGRVATSILEQEYLCREVVYLIRDRFGYYHSQIFLLDPDGEWASLYQSTGEVGEQLVAQGYRAHTRGESVVGRAISTREPVVARGSGIDITRYAPGMLAEARSQLAIPLAVGNRIIGALDFFGTDVESFTQEDVDVLGTLASQVAVAINNAQAYREQQETAEKLREVDRLKTQFLANMSHELRTPLNSIIGFSRVILKGIDGPLTELQKTDLTAIHNSGQHLLGLINDILDMSKIEAGKMDLNLEDTDLKPIIKGVMSSAIALVKDKEVQLVQDVPDDLPNVWADGNRVRQVMLNLLSNSSKFTDEGRITLGATYDDDFVTVRVTDTGIGIPNEKLPLIFEEFTQVDASTTRRAGGTGLGLPISRHFVEMQGGEIWVESKEGVGSTFSFTLPIRPPTEKPKIDKVEGETRDGARPLVLAVDDDPGVITLYTRFLEKQGYQVIGIGKSSDVLEKVKEYEPFAVTLDILMPGKDGWEVLRDLKDDPQTRDIPVVICSIVSDEGRGFSMGASDYLVKPIIEEDLLTALDRLSRTGGEDEVRVLVIDDQADDILLIRRILEAQQGYRVIEAGGGERGIEMIQKKQPHLIILDLMMPDIDGFGVLESLKRNPTTRSIPVIVVTAKELVEEDRKKLSGKVEVLLKKGIFTEAELLEDVSRALRRVNH